MKKEKIHKFGKDYYLLGKRKEDHKKIWLERGSFNCGWYWGLGYVEVFTKKYFDIEEHTHFNSLFLKKDIYDSFLEYFEDITIEKEEIWKLLELMSTAYKMRDYSDLLYCGGAHITTNELANEIKNEKEYKRINNILIPKILNKVYKLLSEEAKENE